MSLEVWFAFSAASIVLLVIPGPTVLLVVSYALGQGWKAALPMAAGVALGDFTAMTLSMLGVGALLAASATVFTLVKWAGAAYLVWLGIKLFRAGGTLHASARYDSVHPARMLVHAWLVTALNPKSITFSWLSCLSFSARTGILRPRCSFSKARFWCSHSSMPLPMRFSPPGRGAFLKRAGATPLQSGWRVIAGRCWCRHRFDAISLRRNRHASGGRWRDRVRKEMPSGPSAKRGGAAGDFASGTQAVHQIACCKRIPDGALGVNASVRSDHRSAFSSERLASGISAVITIAPGREFSAIQSSAASSLSETTIRSTRSASRGWR